VSNEDKVVLAGILDTEGGIPGSAAMTYIFPSDGNYDVSVRFYKGDDVLGQTTFYLSVDKQPTEAQVVFFPIVLVVMTLIVLLFKKFKIRNTG